MAGSTLPSTGLTNANSSVIIGNPDLMFNQALEAIAQAELFLTQLGQGLQVSPPVIEPNFPTVVTPPMQLTATLGTLRDVAWTTPVQPTALTATLDISGLLPAVFSDAPPVLAFPTAPSSFSAAEPDAPPVDLNLVFPELQLELPAPPQLLSLQAITFDGLDLPTFDATVPEMTAVAPSVIPYGPEQVYTSPQLVFLQGVLQDRIQNGRTGLPPAVENAIWERAREREYRAQADALADLDRMEAMGFALPPGTYLDARLKIQTETQNTIVAASREVMIKQAELELDNVLKSLEQLNALESRLIDYANQVGQRAFDAVRYATEAGVAVYNGQVQAFSARLEAYRTAATVYQAQLQGELSRVEVYKAQLQGEQTKAAIDQMLVEQYKVQTDVALANIEVFKAQLGAVQTRAEVEKTKVEVFGEQIKAFVGKINAYTANVEGYRATIQAETTKQDAYRSRVQAYTAQVDAGVRAAEAKIQEYRGRVDAKTAEWEGYKAATAGMSAQAQAVTAYNTSQVEAYRATATGYTAYNELLTKQWQVALDQNERVAEIAIKTAEANAQLYMTSRSMALDGAKVGAQVTSQLAASALNSIHFASNFSHSWSIADSTSTSTSESNSTSNSTSESTSTSTSTSNSTSNSTNINQNINLS